MSVASWSVRRVLVVCASWVLAFGTALAATLAISLWRARPPGALGMTSDFAITVTSTEIRAGVLLLLLPPIAFTLVWTWQRFRLR